MPCLCGCYPDIHTLTPHTPTPNKHPGIMIRLLIRQVQTQHTWSGVSTIEGNQGACTPQRPTRLWVMSYGSNRGHWVSGHCLLVWPRSNNRFHATRNVCWPSASGAVESTVDVATHTRIHSRECPQKQTEIVVDRFRVLEIFDGWAWC